MLTGAGAGIGTAAGVDIDGDRWAGRETPTGGGHGMKTDSAQEGGPQSRARSVVPQG